MKRAATVKTIVVSAGLIASLWTMRANAEEFETLSGVEAQAISSNEMATVEGKLFEGLFGNTSSGSSLFGFIPHFSGSGGLGGDALAIFDPKLGLIASRDSKPNLGLLVLNLSGLTPPEFRQKISDAIGVLGPDGLLFDVNAGKKAPLVLLQLNELNLGGDFGGLGFLGQ